MITTIAYPTMNFDLMNQWHADLKIKNNDSYLLKYISLSNFIKRKYSAELRLIWAIW